MSKIGQKEERSKLPKKLKDKFILKWELKKKWFKKKHKKV